MVDALVMKDHIMIKEDMTPFTLCVYLKLKGKVLLNITHNKLLIHRPQNWVTVCESLRLDTRPMTVTNL